MATPIEPPPLVARATAAATAAGFTNSCSPEVGRLLATICATKPAGRVAEAGAGYGVGTSWLHSGLGTGATLVTVDREPDCARATAALFAGESRVQVLTGDWRALEAHAPFDVLFCDGGGKRDDPQRVVEWLAPGGVLVLDDFTPSASWPPMYDGAVDHLRVLYLTHHLLHAVEIVTGPGQAAILAARL
jgi:predicted O-methyltransferase YrrM